MKEIPRYRVSHKIAALLNGLRNLTHLQSSGNSSTLYREGDIVKFACTGDIGKPPGKLIWQTTSPGQKRPIIYSNETTDVEPIPDICSFRGTSNLTVKISAEHFQAIFRCFEESQASLPEMHLETTPMYTVSFTFNLVFKLNKMKLSIVLCCEDVGNILSYLIYVAV